MIKIALSLFIASLTLFLAAEALAFLPIASLTRVLYPIGASLLLASFSLLFITLLLNACKFIAKGICRYFSGIERGQRRLWFVQGKLDRERRLIFHRRLQTRYFLDVKRKRLELANTRKHSRSLSKAIIQDLAKIKPHVSAAQLGAWQQQNQTYRRQANIEGLIALQLTIIAHLN